MKITAMHGAEALNVLCDLIEPASRILEDQVTAEAMRKLTALSGKKMHPIALYALIGVALRPVIKAHGDDLMQIAAALTGKPLDEVRKQPLLDTIKDVRAVWDDDLRDFFTSSAPTAAAE